MDGGGVLRLNTFQLLWQCDSLKDELLVDYFHDLCWLVDGLCLKEHVAD